MRLYKIEVEARPLLVAEANMLKQKIAKAGIKKSELCTGSWWAFLLVSASQGSLEWHRQYGLSQNLFDL